MGAVVTPWLGRFVEALPISAEGAFRLTAARDGRTGRECVVACPAPDAEPALARDALERAFDAHRAIEHPIVARAYELGPDREYVAFDCPARLDLPGLLMASRDHPPRVSHGAADGFITSLRDALFAAAEHGDPRDGGPCCIGTLGYSNILLARDGRFWLLGLGHNLALADEHGRIGGRSTAFQAPEVAIGERPTRSSDFVTLLLFMRSLVPFMILEPSIRRALTGNSLSEDIELVAKLIWFERNVVTALPRERASTEDAIAASDRIRALLGVQPDPDAFRTEIAAILAGHSRLRAADAAAAWRVASDGAYLERAGADRIRVPGRSPLRKIALALAHARIERPGSGLAVSDLFAAGWPAERASPRAARNRVHVAVNKLRRMGLATDLESHAGAYRISPAVFLELVDPVD